MSDHWRSTYDRWLSREPDYFGPECEQEEEQEPMVIFSSSREGARKGDRLEVDVDLPGAEYIVTLRGMGDVATCSFTGDDLRLLRRQLTDLLWRNEA